MTRLNPVTIIVVLVAIALASCLKEEPEPITTTPPEEEEPLRFSSALSECGGFAETEEEPTFDEEATYCDAERLRWAYNAATGNLDLRDTRITLNCCGDRDVSVELIDGVYVITETDSPLEGELGARCNCMCVFDFDISIEDIDEEVISLRLIRDITDGGGSSTIWEGEIDLTVASGSVIVDDADYGLCDEPIEELSFSGQTSDCGGFGEADGDGDDDLDSSYCDTERLDWVYNDETETLELIDSRALLNCCGDHSIAIVEEDGVYVITEIDRAEDGMGRCDCMCVFDFALTTSGIPAATIPARLMRHVTDESDTPVMIWEGEIDLTLGAGSIEIDDTDVGMWCEES